MTLVIILAAIVLLYILSVRCRKGHPGLESLRGWAYAHRGLHGNGLPENSMAAFRAALEGGYGIELDVHLMKDGNLAVIHDASLKRTAGVDVRIEDLTTEDLENYRLEGTEERIPLFSELLALYDGKAPLVVELKPEGGNQAALVDATCRMLESYNGAYCVESFDPRCVSWLKKKWPRVIRGQLAENFLVNPKSKLPRYLKTILSYQMMNFTACPDFVAYRYIDRKHISNFVARKIWGAQGVSWTITSQEDFDTAVKDGWLPIFEGFRP